MTGSPKCLQKYKYHQETIVAQCYTLDMYKLLCRGAAGGGGWHVVRHVSFFMSLKITFSHDVFTLFLFFLYLIKVEHPPTKLQELARSATRGEQHDRRER